MRYICLIIMCTLSLSSNAKDFGTKGHTFQIVEQAFLQMIDERLHKVDIEKERAKMEILAKERINNPSAIEGINIATKNRVFYFDPTYRLDSDAILPCGKILYKAGTTVNPLEHMDLNRRLFFVDARRKEQIDWLKSQLNNPLPPQKELVEDKIVLVAGSPIKLAETLGREVYFDQQGVLTTKFGIKASPASVEQDGKQLRIEEFKLKPK